ncbi:MAG: hypothetical protein JOZ74_06265, partial [Bradyrhizobium sp.]|nr:hypothetical protein [Bradyrhizobium sp.]
ADKAGLLSGLLAEENEFDRRSLWRIGSWGVAAVGAVVLAVAANQSSLGWRRDQGAAADIARQAQQIQTLTKESQNETRRLAAAIDTLNSDRDRLFSRLTVIEQGLDSVTGTIAKQSATAASASAASAPPKPTPPVSAMPAMITAPPVMAADNTAAIAAPPQGMPPSVTPATTTAAPAPDKARTTEQAKIEAKIEPVKAEGVKIEPAKADPTAESAALPQIAANKSAAPPAPAAAQTSAPAIGATKSMMGPPDPGAPRLMETTRTAAAAPSPAPETGAAASPPKDQEKPELDAEATKEADKSPIQRTEFAVELGGANSIGGLRALWRGLLKSNNAELAELRPIIVLREGNTGLGMQLRLAAGPLHDAAEAAKICAALAESKRACETTVFDGQRLALGVDEAPPAPDGKPPAAAGGRSTSYKHYTPKHAKKDDPPPAPPKESSTFSSLFGMAKH